MKTEKFVSLFKFTPKSKVKAGEGLDEGNFPFYTSSAILKKRINKAQVFDEALIFGTGGSASIHFSSEPFATSADCIVAIKENDSLNTKYVYYYLFGNIHLLERGFKGAGLKHLSKKYIENLDIPILSIEIQNKIVSVLDKASSLVDKREEAIGLLEELLRSVFLKMFQSELLNFKKQSIPLSEITSIFSGITKGRKTKSTDLVDVPYLRVANAQNGYFDLTEIKYIPATKKEIEQFNVINGDILITEGGDPDKLGRGAIWEMGDNKFIYQNHLYRLRPHDKEQFSPYWLIQLLNSEYGKYYFLRQSKQTTGIATINKRQVSNFPVPICSFEKKKEFERKYLQIKLQKASLFSSLIEIKTLQSSILQKVFNGQLNFNVDFELDALINEIDLQKKKNDLSKISGDIAYLQRLIDKLNDQEFTERNLYDKAKHGLFQLMAAKDEEQKVIQEYHESSNSLKLAIK